MTKMNIMENDKGKWERRTGRTERVPGQAEGYGMTTGRRWGGMYFWVDRTDRAEDGEDGVGTGCPLTSTPPSEKRRPGAMVGEIGLNLIKSKSAVRIRLAAPGCLR